MRRQPEHPIQPTISGPGPDLVFDYQDMKSPDLGGIVLLLTARQVATERLKRRVWLRALPHQSWEILKTLGLESLFEFFPQTRGNIN